MCAKVESKHQGFKFTSSDYLSITLKVNKYYYILYYYILQISSQKRQIVHGSLCFVQVVCDLLIKKAEEREATSFRSSNLLVINTQTTRAIEEKQCPIDTGNESDKAAEKEANINKSEPLSTSTSTIPRSSQNKGGQSGNSFDETGTDASNSTKSQNQNSDETDSHQLERKVESVEAETPHSKVLKSAEKTRKTEEERPLSEQKTDREINDDSSSVTQIEGCESDVEDGEIQESSPEEDKLDSNDRADEKKECDAAKHNPVNTLYLCLCD